MQEIAGNSGDLGSIPGSGTSSEEGNGKGKQPTKNVDFLVELIGDWWGGPRVRFTVK